MNSFCGLMIKFAIDFLLRANCFLKPRSKELKKQNAKFQKQTDSESSNLKTSISTNRNILTKKYILKIKSRLVKPFARLVARQIAGWSQTAIADQEKIRQQLIHQAKNTHFGKDHGFSKIVDYNCLLYTSPSPRDATLSRMPSSA